MDSDAKLFTELIKKSDLALKERDLLQTRLEVLDKRLEKYDMKVGMIMEKKRNE